MNCSHEVHFVPTHEVDFRDKAAPSTTGPLSQNFRVPYFFLTPISEENLAILVDFSIEIPANHTLDTAKAVSLPSVDSRSSSFRCCAVSL